MKFILLCLAVISGFSYAEITNPGPGGISISTTESHVINIVSTDGLHKITLGSHFESDLNTQYSLNASVQAPDGTIYGADWQTGQLIKYDTNSNPTVVHTFTNSTDGGIYPLNLVYRNGYIYGQVSGRDASDIGSLWKVAVDGSNFTTLHKFNNNGDGYIDSLINGTTIDPQGNIYGSTNASLYQIDNNDTITFLSTQFPVNGLVYRNNFLYGDGLA